MLNENRVKLMARMAVYESTQGKEDQKISSYHKKDYSSFHTLITIIWITIGYAIVCGLVLIGYLDLLMTEFSMQRMIVLAAVAVGGYLAMVIAFGIGASNFYKKRYNLAKKRMKQYYRDLTRLGKLYEKER